MTYDTAIILLPVACLLTGGCFGWWIRDTRAVNERVQMMKDRNRLLDMAHAGAEKRISHAYHQGAIDTMNAIEPKRDKAGRFISNKVEIAKTEGSLSL
jgi:hypothetical protein